LYVGAIGLTYVLKYATIVKALSHYKEIDMAKAEEGLQYDDLDDDQKAFFRVLYHHESTTDTIVLMLTSIKCSTPPPEPTEEDVNNFGDNVNKMVENYHFAFKKACNEVLGEGR